MTVNKLNEDYYFEIVVDTLNKKILEFGLIAATVSQECLRKVYFMHQT